jgi:hypothetical protein
VSFVMRVRFLLVCDFACFFEFDGDFFVCVFWYLRLRDHSKKVTVSFVKLTIVNEIMLFITIIFKYSFG